MRIDNSYCQLSGFYKLGLNFSYINKSEWYIVDTGESGEYGTPLIRLGIGSGLEFKFSNYFYVRQGVFYQTKGQGNERPRVWSLYRTTDKDIIRLVSFPLAIKYKISPKLATGIALQPSVYLGGSDNYAASESWNGWIWGAVVSFQYSINKTFELGLEYDYDFTKYYCPLCDEQFNTIRLYSIYKVE